MQVLGPSQPVPSPRELVVQLKGAIDTVVAEQIMTDVEPERLYQLRQAQKYDKYWRGLQYVAPQWFEGMGGQYTSVGTPLSNEEDRSNAGAYDYVRNIVRGLGKKLIAVLGQRAPNTRAIPDDPDDDDIIHVTRVADNAGDVLESRWDIKERNKDLARMLYKTSTVFSYVGYRADGRKYGYTQEPVVEPVETPGPDGVPVQTIQSSEPQQYENGSVEMSLHDITTVSCPYYIRRIDEAHWLRCEDNPYKGALILAFPQLAEEAESESDPGGAGNFPSSQTADLVRDMMASPMGLATPRRSNRWKRDRIWLTPDVYPTIKGQQFQQLLAQYFRDGVKCTFINGKLIALDNEKLTDHWAACQPESDDYIFGDPVCKDAISFQDLKNDMVNIAAETFERGLPMTIVDPRVIDPEIWASKPSRPVEIMPAIAAVGENLAASFYQTPPATFSAQMIPFMQESEEEVREILGILPAIFGGTSDVQTAHQAELQKNAALMQLGTIWSNMCAFWAKTKENGVRELARNGIGTLSTTKKTSIGWEKKVVDISELKETGWHFECEEAIPQSLGQQRDTVMYMLDKPPQVLDSLGFSHPINIPHIQSLLGFDGWHRPAQDLQEKTLATIKQLLDGAPTPQMDGSLAPSIPVDEFEDDHALVVSIGKDWMVSGQGRSAHQGKPDGYANVLAWLTKHAALAKPAPPPPPPPKLSLQDALKDQPLELQAAIYEDYGLVKTAAAAQALLRQQQQMQQMMGSQAAIPPGPPLPGATPAGAGGAAPPQSGPATLPPQPPPTALTAPPGLQIPNQDLPTN